MSRFRTISPELPATNWAIGFVPQHDAPFSAKGTIATVARVIGGVTYPPLSIFLMSRGPRGLGLRSPIGLNVGASYELRMGMTDDDAVLIRITSSRSRNDGSYDIGAVEFEHARGSHAAAA